MTANEPWKAKHQVATLVSVYFTGIVQLPAASHSNASAHLFGSLALLCISRHAECQLPRISK